MRILLRNKIPFFPHLTVSWSLPVARIIFLKSSQIQWLYKPAMLKCEVP